MGVDWITVVGLDEAKLGSLLQLGHDLVTVGMRRGFERRGWGMSGFSGFASSGVQYGVRGKEVIVRLSGDLAHTHWRKAYALGTNCTRVDFECTTRVDGDADARVARAYAAARRHSRRKANGPTVAFITSTRGGNTCYLGSRHSQAFGRVYNKHAQSRESRWSNCVRYEVELKSDLCSRTISHVDRQRVPDVEIAGRVLGFFRGRGVPLELPTDALTPMVVPRSITDHERQLRWLGEQCGPTLRRLLACGMEADVIKALGLHPSSTMELNEADTMRNSA